MPMRYRDACKRPGSARVPLSAREMARRKAQTYDVRASFWDARRVPLGAPIAVVFSAPGPAFRRRQRREWPAGMSAAPGGDS
jgi:hypothetical protein